MCVLNKHHFNLIVNLNTLFMRIITFLLLFLFCFNLSRAQNGDEITDAVLCPDSTPITAFHVSDATTASSISAPNCVSGGIDAFYFNPISASDNKITIGMETTYAVNTTIHYQILRAPAGDINNLQEYICSSFDVIVGVPPLTDGGSFSTEITTNVNSTDVYYLRVYKPTGLTDPIIEALFDATTVSMTSENDGTLSFSEFSKSNIKLVMKTDRLEIINNSQYYNYRVYSISGKLIKEKKQKELVSQVDISFFNKGVYLLMLDNGKKNKVYKFIK